MYNVIATDLDGTLLNSDHQLDPFTVATLKTLDAQGLRFVIATGRHYCDVAGIRDRLGIRPYLITSNGARVHAPDDTLIHAANLPESTVQRLVAPDVTDAGGATAAHRPVTVSLFTDDAWLISREAPEMLAFHQESGFAWHVTDLRAHDGVGIGKALYVGDPADLAQIEQRLAHEFGDALYITYSLPDCLEVMTQGVSKGRALRVVLERLGIAAAGCIAFGDNLNDIDLLETAGHPFMMNNANPDLIARLPTVPRIGNNFEAGVAHHLRKLFALGDEGAA
jgi:Cof subfamily protein (haloacid dehalogenase superfamily)